MAGKSDSMSQAPNGTSATPARAKRARKDQTNQANHANDPVSAVRAKAGKLLHTTNGRASTMSNQTDTPQKQLYDTLTPQAKLELENYLTDNFNPFAVNTIPPSKKRKRDSKPLSIQDDLWDERLTVHYEVKPNDKWESLRKYKKFTVMGESIATGQCILVKHDDSAEAQVDISNQWKAKVLEVRALDTEHVYIRVAWLNRPEDLENGRKDYHGRYELIPTNQMDVIDAMSVNGVFDIVQWNDFDDNDGTVDDQQYFWRQTYDYANTKTFSKLRPICIDKKPQNPDEMIIQCSHEDCRKWLHVKCIAEQAVEAAGDNKKAAKKKDRPSNANISTSTSAVAKAVKGKTTSEVLINGTSNEPDDKPAERSEIVITHANGEREVKDLCCLECGKVIQD